VGELVVQCDQLCTTGAKAGMVVDFSDLKQALTPLLEEHLDHWHLNDSTGLANPTSEELARWIFDQLKPLVPALISVVVEETCTSRCEYWP
jgi:6-pyruvoyltetrahydropterin/6-carboxytetrahydropterin synthase